MKQFIKSAMVGGLGGAMLSSWGAPRFIAWWFEPPVPLGFSCRTPIEYALRRLQWAQMGGILLGGLLGVVLYIAISRRNHQS